MDVHAVNMAADLLPRDAAILKCFQGARKSFNQKECLALSRFALEKFLPFTSDVDSPGALYKDAAHRWEAMLALWQKRELPDPTPPPKKRTRRAGAAFDTRFN